jgi:hypothetical protein
LRFVVKLLFFSVTTIASGFVQYQRVKYGTG